MDRRQKKMDSKRIARYPTAINNYSNLDLGIVQSTSQQASTDIRSAVETTIQSAPYNITAGQIVSALNIANPWFLPWAVLRLINVNTSRNALIAIGTYIKTQLRYQEFDTVRLAVAESLQKVAVQAKRSVIYGLLTTDTAAEATDLSGPNNIGPALGVNLIEMAHWDSNNPPTTYSASASNSESKSSMQLGNPLTLKFAIIKCITQNATEVNSLHTKIQNRLTIDQKIPIGNIVNHEVTRIDQLAYKCSQAAAATPKPHVIIVCGGQIETGAEQEPGHVFDLQQMSVARLLQEQMIALDVPIVNAIMSEETKADISGTDPSAFLNTGLPNTLADYSISIGLYNQANPV
ncbi:hypothetical protein AAMO2058_001367000 [Amorphochlora amoebiformis]